MVKRGMDFKKITCFDKFVMLFHFECCASNLVSNNIIVICIYRTPSKLQRHVTCFLEKLDLLLFTCFKKFPNKRIIITGDMNINLINPNCARALELKEIIKKYNLHIHINKPTRQNSCLDLILSNINNALGSVLPLWLSHHDTAQVLKFAVSQKKQHPKVVYSYKRCYSEQNIDKFKRHLKCISFTKLFEHSDVNQAFHEFHNMFCLLYKLCFPVNKIRKDLSNKPRWITKELQKCCATKRILRHLYYKNKTDVDRKKYLQYNNLLKKCIRNSKKITNKAYIETS